MLSMLTWTRDSEEGSELVEFALILVPLSLFIFGIIEMGALAMTYSSLVNVAREGARAGIVTTADTGTVEAAAQAAAFGLDGGQLTITVAWPNSAQVRVTARYDYQPITGQIIPIAGADGVLPLQAVATMRRE